MKKLAIALLMMISSIAMADEVAEQVKAYRAMEYMNFVSGLESSDKDDCYPMPDLQSCVKYACSTVRSFECNDQSEIQRLFEACRGNYGDQCLRKAVSKLRSFEYDDLEEMAELGVACRGVFDVSCVDFVCDRLGSFKCDDRNEIVNVLNQCKY